MKKFNFKKDIVKFLKTNFDLELLEYDTMDAHSKSFYGSRMTINFNYNFNGKLYNDSKTMWRPNSDLIPDLCLLAILERHQLSVGAEITRGQYKGSFGKYTNVGFNKPGVNLGKTKTGKEIVIGRKISNIKLYTTVKYLIKSSAVVEQNIDDIEILDLFGHKIKTGDLIAFPERGTLDVGRIVDYDCITAQFIIKNSKDQTRVFGTGYRFINLTTFDNETASDFLTISLLSC